MMTNVFVSFPNYLSVQCAPHHPSECPVCTTWMVSLTSDNDCCSLTSAAQVLWPWRCERVCPEISVSPDTSLMVVSGDRTVTAECDRAVDSETGAVVWGEARLRHRHTLLLSCTDLYLDSELADSFSGGIIKTHKAQISEQIDLLRTLSRPGLC